MNRHLTPTVVVLILCCLYILSVLIRYDGDPLAFVLLGTQFTQGDAQGSEGYDGQFAYQIALSPLGASPYLDVPAYRYQRILYPMLARFLALGQADWIPWMLILLNLIAIGVGTWATEQLLILFRVNRWYALAYGLYGGQFMALRTDLNEPLAHMFIQLAMLAWAKKKHRSATIAFALAALSKETALIFLAAYLLYTFIQRQWSKLLILALGAVPFVLYQFLLWSWLGRFGVGSGGAGATSFSLIPLGGWLAIAQVDVLAFGIISLIMVPMSILPSVAGVWLAIRHWLTKPIHPFIIALLLNALVILFLPFSTFREPVAMLRLTMGLVSAMLLYGALTRSWRILNYSLLWIATNALLLKDVAG